MGWMESIGDALLYIEDNLTEELTIKQIARRANLSPFYFQKGFTMLCGFTVLEYVRQRRLTLAGSEVIASNRKIIDIAFKYGYDSPDSFTKAFTRFHGSTPTAVRKNGASIKSLACLKIKFTLEGGTIMDFKIVEKETFMVIGSSEEFHYESAFTEIPEFWGEHCRSDKSKFVCGMYGVCIEETGREDCFEYLIADDYTPGSEIPAGFVVRTIPKHTWAVFAGRGAIPDSLQSLNQKIFSEWIPNCRDYKIAAGYNIEYYSPLADLPNGMKDENYYFEIWIPVKSSYVNSENYIQEKNCKKQETGA